MLIWQTLYDLKATYPPETSGPNKGKPPRVSACDHRLMFLHDASLTHGLRT